MKFPTAAAVWASIVLLAAILGILHGFGGPQFVIALGVAAVLFAFEFFLAAPEGSGCGSRCASRARRDRRAVRASIRGADLFVWGDRRLED